MLARLRIRGKLAVLLIIPLVAVVVLTTVVVAGRSSQAARSADTARAARIAGEIGALIQDLQQERLLTVGYLVQAVDRSQLLLQTAAVTDRVTSVRANLSGELSPEESAAIDEVSSLAGLRASVVSGSGDIDLVLAQYTEVTEGLIDALRLIDAADATTPEGRQLVALDALLRVDEGNSAGAALMTVMVSTRTSRDFARYAANAAAVQPELNRFTAYAAPEQVKLYGLVTDAFTARVGNTFAANFEVDPIRAIFSLKIDALFRSLESYIVLGRFVEKKIVSDVTAAVTGEQRQQTSTAYALAGVSLGLLLFVVLLSAVTARAVARPLSLLTASATRVAQIAEAELVRVGDDEADTPDPVRLEPLDVGGRDEIGDLARAFDRVQQTAAQLVERQVTSRRNVAQMFGHVGRRTQNLVGRQIGLIDRLESDETEPGRLRQLYRLDHVTSRLRRNANSLVVLSGGTGTDPHLAPLPLADAVRLALGEIEEYERVDVEVPGTIVLAPAIVSDLVLLLAELMENASTNSPPHTRVTVTAGEIADGVRVSIADHGIGMPGERMAVENARLTRRERIDLAPTEVLGLFVVGRLARRHGLRVSLAETPGGGVTATVVLGRDVLDASGAPRAGRPASIAPVVDVAALARATRSIDSGQPWNAFTTPRREPAGDGARVEAAVLDRPVDDDVTTEIPVLPKQSLPEQSLSGQSLPGQSLRRRVPGAQVPPDTRAARSARAPAAAPADPGGAQALVEAFEDGVRRALREAGIGAGQDSGSSAPAPAVTARNLVRRVPGATLPEPGTADRPGPRAADGPPPDPDRARDLVEQFESGVLRALRHLRSEGTNHEQ